MKTCPRCLTPYGDGRDRCEQDGEKLVSAASLAPVDTGLRPGTVVGEYVVEERLGEGGFGSVYRAEHPLIGKRVAIKVLHLQYSQHPQMIARFVAEARAVNQIRHPNIVDIFAFGNLPDGRRYYVMELLEGLPLDRFLKMAGPVPPELALPLLGGIAQALDAAHAVGIVHRDLKPENVFIAFREGSRASAKLLDFGIAKLLGEPHSGSRDNDTTNTGAPVGTPHYMSPEQCRGRPVDHRTDVYSLGILLHRVLTDKLPFQAHDTVELLNQQVSATPPRLSKVNRSLPAAMDEPVLRMLAKDPAKRPDSIAVAMEAVIRAAAGAGVKVAVDVLDVDTRLLVDSSGNYSDVVASHVPKPRPSRQPAFSMPADPAADTLPGAPPLPTIEVPESRLASRPPPEEPKVKTTTSEVTWQGPATSPPPPGRKKPWIAAVAAMTGIALVLAVVLGLRAATDRSSGVATASAASVGPSVTAAQTAIQTAAPTAVQTAAETRPTATQEAPPAEISVTINDVPTGTKVYKGGTLLGTAPGSVRLPRGAQTVSLKIATADGRTAQLDVVPDQDRSVAVTLPPRTKGAPPSGTTTRPRDLEPF
ncbi:MAG: protein kinase [Polyangiaceae bacterium]